MIFFQTLFFPTIYHPLFKSPMKIIFPDPVLPHHGPLGRRPEVLRLQGNPRPLKFSQGPKLERLWRWINPLSHLWLLQSRTKMRWKSWLQGWFWWWDGLRGRGWHREVQEADEGLQAVKVGHETFGIFQYLLNHLCTSSWWCTILDAINGGTVMFLW